MKVLKANYELQKKQNGYMDFISKVNVVGTWDDHDYGMNDAGVEYLEKEQSQQLFLDFINLPKTDERRNQKGVYHAEMLSSENGSVKVIILDTRYFRTKLTNSKTNRKRYQPNDYGKGTILGEQQWIWLKKELTTSTADFNIIVSSIQYLSHEHGFESWGNFPHEFDKLQSLLKLSNAKNVMIISGDRHISEFSKIDLHGLKYPLIDFTSSGMTHSYSSFNGEPNVYRSGKVVKDISFGILQFDFENDTVKMQMRGDDNVLQQELIQDY